LENEGGQVATERASGPQGNNSASPVDAEAFEASLKRRGRAAKGLEQDLLTEVPMLYGSPGRGEPEGDPGIILARIHQEELLRRHGGGVPPGTRKRSDVALPFERTMLILPLAILTLLFLLD
jgi:hypothetical protein